MRESLGPIPLLNRNSGQFETGELFRGVTETDLESVERHWRPLIDARREGLAPEDYAQAQIQDFHWDWRKKLEARKGTLASESFALELAGETQGLLFAKTVWFARAAEHQGLDAVYIEYVATAPWNRHGFTLTPLYKGVGTVLLAAAISLSVHLDFRGRIGLHSMPQSEDWYRDRCRMIDLGADLSADRHGRLHYFEMTAEQARTFLSQGVPPR